MGSPTSAVQPGTHLHHGLEGDGAIGCSHGEMWQLEGREALGDAAGECERLGAHHLEGVSNQASKQDHKGIACCNRESNHQNLSRAQAEGRDSRSWVLKLLRCSKH